MMTLQQIFDKAATHLITQNACSARGGSCMYRGPEGRMCAAGPFIPEDKYKFRFEGLTVLASHDDIPRFPSRQADSLAFMDAIGMKPGSPEACLLRGLQHIHDAAAFGGLTIAYWPAKLRELAAIWGLNADAVEAALAKRELQRVFDRALRGVRAQGRAALRGEACVYYDEATERRCGVGQALTRAQAMDLQDELDSSRRPVGLQGVNSIMSLLTAAGLPDAPEFLSRIQSAHDSLRHVKDFLTRFENGMAVIAADYGLKYTAPEVGEATCEGSAS